MDALQAIILGIIQGITEFLPISSSGHLVIVPYLLGWEFPEKDKFVFDVLVQVATMVAVIAYFWSDLWGIARGFIRALLDKAPFGTQEARLGWYLILATIPASLVGLAFKDLFERAFSTPLAAAGFLLLTAVLLLVAERVGSASARWSRFNLERRPVDWLFSNPGALPGDFALRRDHHRSHAARHRSSHCGALFFPDGGAGHAGGRPAGHHRLISNPRLRQPAAGLQLGLPRL
jgi:undecaprenyl-diphosphatase